jgi:hypothetical protein
LHRLRWFCQCDCGGSTWATRANLHNGKTTSCGCRRVEVSTRVNQTHGLSNTREYITWCHLRARCENPKTPAFKRYGGRGITVCERWRASFLNFLADMGNRPSDGHSIDRIDVNGPYSPENCRWATSTTQCNNRRDSVFYEWNGKRQTLAQWSKELGMVPGTLRSRLDAGWSIHRAFTDPLFPR